MADPRHRTASGALTPPRLRRGDTLALVSLSAGLAHRHPNVIEVAARVLGRRFGWRLVPAPNAARSADELYRDPRARADDLHWALESDEVAGILTAIGGDESVRLLPYVDPALVRRHPKAFVGFSDSTTTHVLYARARVVSFYGPAAMSGIADGEAHPGVLASFGRALAGGAAPWVVEPMPGWSGEPIRWERPDYAEAVAEPRALTPTAGHALVQGTGTVEGPLVGGCAEVLEMLKGTAFWYPDDVWEGAVLLLETSEMVPHPALVEFWLRNYGTQGVLQRLSGLVLARARGYDDTMRARLFEAVRRVLAEVGREDLVVLAEVDIGHTQPIHTLPLSCRVRLEAGVARLTVLEDGVH